MGLTSQVVGEDILFPPNFQWQHTPSAAPPSSGSSNYNHALLIPVPPSTTVHHLCLHPLLTTSIPFPHIYVREKLRLTHPACRPFTDRAIFPMTVSLDGPSCSAPTSQLLHPPIDMNDLFNPRRYFDNNVETM